MGKFDCAAGNVIWRLDIIKFVLLNDRPAYLVHSGLIFFKIRR